MLRRLLLIIGILLVVMSEAFAYVPNGDNTDLGGEYRMWLPHDIGRRRLLYYPGYLHVGDKVYDVVEIRDITENKTDEGEEVVAIGTVGTRNGRLTLKLNFSAKVKYSCDHNTYTERCYLHDKGNWLYEVSGGEGSLSLKPIEEKGPMVLFMSAEGNYQRSERQLYALTDMATLYALESISGANYPQWLMQAWRNHYQYKIDWAMDELYSKMVTAEQKMGRSYSGGMEITVFDEQGATVDRLATDAFAEHIYRIGRDRQLSLLVDRRIE